MPIATRCTEPGCEVLTIGLWCVAHDREPRPHALPRGRPFPPAVPVAGLPPGPRPVVMHASLVGEALLAEARLERSS